MLASQSAIRSESLVARNGKVWAVILAGGQGARMLDWIETTRGERCPKQFCTFTGSRSMLEHTLDRARAVAASDRTITVITRGQARHLAKALKGALPGRLIEQPLDRGTAAGVLLAVAHVIEQDPDAVVLILPADHFVRPESIFERHATSACRLAKDLPGRLVVLGAAPDGPETDYGWILCEPSAGASSGDDGEEAPRSVIHFREKPAPAEAARLYDAGGLWNTLVIATRARTLWSLAARLVPEMSTRFSVLREVMRSVRGRGTPRHVERMTLSSLYRGMQPADFSRDILQAAVGSTVVLPMRGLEWSDWGRPERVLQTLQTLGRIQPHATAPQRAATRC